MIELLTLEVIALWEHAIAEVHFRRAQYDHNPSDANWRKLKMAWLLAEEHFAFIEALR